MLIGTLYFVFNINGLAISALPGAILPEDIPASTDSSANLYEIVVAFNAFTKIFQITPLIRIFNIQNNIKTGIHIN